MENMKNTKALGAGPLVSVVLPTYNRAWSLGEAVDSVLAQDYPHIETIVVDDGSTDNTRALLEPYGDRIMVLTQTNQGVSAARNAGIRKSRGELIALLDSDDVWDNRKISCQVDFFRAHPDAMICQTEEIWIRNGHRVNPKRRHRKPSGMIFEPSLHLCLVSPSAVMMKRELFDLKGYFNEAFTVCEDYDLWLRVGKDLPIYLIDRPYTVKRGGHRDQLSGMHSQDRFRIRSLLALVQSGDLTPDQERAARQVLADKCLVYGNGCRKRGRSDEAARYLNLARKMDPACQTGSAPKMGPDENPGISRRPETL